MIIIPVLLLDLIYLLAIKIELTKHFAEIKAVDLLHVIIHFVKAGPAIIQSGLLIFDEALRFY